MNPCSWKVRNYHVTNEILKKKHGVVVVYCSGNATNLTTEKGGRVNKNNSFEPDSNQRPKDKSATLLSSALPSSYRRMPRYTYHHYRICTSFYLVPLGASLSRHPTSNTRVLTYRSTKLQSKFHFIVWRLTSHLLVWHFQELPISNFPRSLPRNATSHSMKNLAFHRLLR